MSLPRVLSRDGSWINSADLGQRLVEVLRGDRLAVEVLVAELGEQSENPLPLASQREDTRRLPLALEGANALEGLDDLLHVVPLDGERLPAERGELPVDRVHVEDVLGGAGLLVMVAI